MSEDEIDVALTPFGQVDGSRARWREGTGLGLPIAKALVELHGGTLEIRSIKDTGTEVSVVLPPPDRVSVAEGREIVAASTQFS
jgi:two-component system cell cycle sensor histidine kinase PleC